MLLETLKQIGLEEKEAKIYLACLELGETGIKDIASKSGIKRTTIYEIIDKMVLSGYLQTTFKGKRKRFLAIEPQELKALMQKRASLLDEVMPQLMSLDNVSDNKPKVWFYQGKDAIMQAYEDSLNYPGSEVVGWASGEVLKMFSVKECTDYIQKRVRRKIMQSLIMPKEKELNEFVEKDSHHLRRTKIVDEEVYPFKIEINIYANRVALFSVKDKMAVIMESDPIASAMRMIFKMCWGSLTEKDNL